ncbi:MAG: serine/threonine-protein kinase [Nitrospirota bacterium]
MKPPRAITEFLTGDERLWLEEFYRRYRAKEPVGDNHIRVALRDKLPKGFKPDRLRRGFVYGAQLGVLGLLVLDPEADLLRDVEQVILAMKSLVISQPDIGKISADQLAERLRLEPRRIEELLGTVGSAGRFWGSGHGGVADGSYSQVTLDADSVRELLEFQSIEQQVPAILEKLKGDNQRYTDMFFSTATGSFVTAASAVGQEPPQLVATSNRTGSPTEFETAFDTYSVTAVVGEGGTGRVFAVKDSGGQPFALKCLFPDRVTTLRRKRFKNEVAFCAKFNHANVIKVVDSGVAKWDRINVPFYVMPLYVASHQDKPLQPTTLRSLMEAGIAHDRVLPLFSQVMAGVEAANLKGVYHRDLKPENILYDAPRDTLIVADFGIAHFEEEELYTAVETRDNERLANFFYAAPEQRSRGQTVDHRADIFALGLILNEMYTRTVPQGTGFPTIASVASAYAYLDGLVEHMRQHAPENRLASLDEIKKQLIGRRSEFVARQELDAKRGEVVPAHSPDVIAPVNVLGLDWRSGALILQLDREPEYMWVDYFQKPRGTYSSTVGLDPHLFKFQGNTATISVQERLAQHAVVEFKKFSDMATRGLQAEVKNVAAKKEAEERRRLQREVEEAEARARIVASTKI